MRMLKPINTLAVLLFSINSLFSQLQVKNHFSFSGKKDLAVNSMCQDLSGFLWLGTAEGLYRFDGKTATAYHEKFPPLKKEITTVFSDNNETIWIGTREGKVYHIKNTLLDSINFSTGPNSEKITSFYDLNGTICIGTYGNGFYTYENNNLKHFTSENGLSDVIYKITGDGISSVWLATDAGITEMHNLKSKAAFKIISNKEGLPDNIVRDISLFNDRLLIAMQDSGICFYDVKKKRFERNGFFSNWTMGTVINAVLTNQGKLFVATEKKGLIELEHGSFNLYNYNDYILTTGINQLFIDRSEQVWLASKRGISQLHEKRFNLINAAKGLRDEKILAIAVDNNNAIWTGATMGVSKIWTSDEGSLLVNKINEHQKHTISCAAKSPDGNIWFGTYGNGIFVQCAESKNTFVINSTNDHLSNDNISHIFFTDQNTVYISTLGGGLIIAHVEIEGNNKLFRIVKTYREADGLGSDYVYASATDSTGKLFIATDGGGLQMLANGKFRDLVKENKLASNTIFSLCRDEFNNIWASSNSDGLLKYDGTKLTVINMLNGLRDMQPQQLIAVDEVLYALNSKGFDKIDCKTNEVSYYDLFESDLEPNLNAVFYWKNKIYCGTNKGILTYRTSKEYTDSIKPIAYIKSLQVNFKTIAIDSVFEFRYNQNNFSIAFDGIWLKNPNQLFFRYRLNGLEDNWQYSDEGKTINYNNLNPGNYTFIVQTKNEEDIWSDPTGYSFIINTPVWKRWWFWLIVASGAALAFYSFVKYRLKALQKENMVLEQKVQERTREIEEQSKIIGQKNKDITDSISYASKIQHAILPSNALIKQHLPNSFVLYMTKDIVSGDFYWFTHFDGFSIIASVDCTGHGVPGAFMSLIGYNQLNRIVNELKITNPKDILVELNAGVIGVLHKNETESKDGMDIAICKINHKQNTLEYAGAMRPLWMVNNGELTEVRADKIPIGTKQKDRSEKIEYTTHTIELGKGNTFYIFTDGYADQFGGPKEKKFSTSKFKELLIANSKLSFEEQLAKVKQEHINWKGVYEQIDDILVIGFTV